MNRSLKLLVPALLTGLFAFTGAFAQEASAQEAGDYRSAATGIWSDAATWSVYDGAAWAPATAAPDGSEAVTISEAHTVTVDVAVTVTGTATVRQTGQLTVGEGTLTFAASGVYDHARDGGSVPLAGWAEGSTFRLTGTIQDAPGNRNQSFHHVTLDTPGLTANRDLGWNEVTIGGDVRVLNTGSGRWQLSSGPAASTRTFTILGDVVLEAGQLAVQGTGNALTTFEVHHHGDVIVNAGNFSLSRGSQGNGSGTTTWFLYGGDFSLANATTQNSNPTPGQARVVFAGPGTQQLAFTNVTYAGGGFHFEAAEGATVEVSDGFTANGLVVNRGTITPLGALTFAASGVYDHARNGGTVPSATWAAGSVARLTGIIADAPANRGQDYHHLVLDTPGLNANRDLSLNGNTIGGDLRVVATGSGRWHLVGGASGTVTLMGDVIVESGQLATQGTGSATEVVVDHYGDVIVTGGNFSISRGTQGGEQGTGFTRWILHEGDLSITNATTQNSNPWRAAFVFSGEEEQALDLDNVTYAGGGLPITVAEGATLLVPGDALGGNGAFTVEDGGTLVTDRPTGVDGVLATTGPITFEPLAGLRFAGTEIQTLGALMPDSVGVLTLANPAGVVVSGTAHAATLLLEAGARLAIEATGELSADGGEILGYVENEGVLSATDAFDFGPEAVYEHARNGGSVPTGNWGEGSTFLLTGIAGNAPGNRNQSFHHIVFDTPNQAGNLNMGFNGVTIGGDIRVVSSGSGRWYLTSAAATESAQLTILGDVIVEGGEFSVHGTGNALTVFTVDHYGDVVVTGGNFSIARGSQGSGENSGSTTWTLHEGDFRMTAGRTQNSNRGDARFVFASGEVQHLEVGGAVQQDQLPIRVEDGTMLDAGMSEVSGNDSFELDAGAHLATAHPGGVAGTIQTTGPVVLDEAASFTFNGSESQVTSDLMPTVVQDLVINNETVVTLSQETMINGVLRLQAGLFDNSVPFMLGENGSISYEGGSLSFPSSSEEAPGPVAETRLYQNHPNPVRSAATIRYDLSESGAVRVSVYDLAGRRVALVVDEVQAPGRYAVEWDGSALAAGVYVYRLTAGATTEVRKLTIVR